MQYSIPRLRVKPTLWPAIATGPGRLLTRCRTPRPMKVEAASDLRRAGVLRPPISAPIPSTAFSKVTANRPLEAGTLGQNYSNLAPEFTASTKRRRLPAAPGIAATAMRETCRYGATMTKSPIKALAIALALATGTLAMTAAGPVTAAAALSDPAAKQIRAFYDALLDSMKHAKALGVQGRYKKLQPAIDATFDFATMTERTVGPGWQRHSGSRPQAPDRRLPPDDDRRLRAQFRRLWRRSLHCGPGCEGARRRQGRQHEDDPARQGADPISSIAWTTSQAAGRSSTSF